MIETCNNTICRFVVSIPLAGVELFRLGRSLVTQFNGSGPGNPATTAQIRFDGSKGSTWRRHIHIEWNRSVSAHNTQQYLYLKWPDQVLWTKTGSLVTIISKPASIQTQSQAAAASGSLLLFSYPALAASPPLFGQQPPTTPRPQVWSVVVVSCSVISRFLASHTISTQTCITRFDYGGIRLGLRLARLETILRIYWTLDIPTTTNRQTAIQHKSVSPAGDFETLPFVVCSINVRKHVQ